MPRAPRTDFPGARHHVMNRGARKEDVFVDDNTCAVFMGLLAQLPDRFGMLVHGFALMPNHYHLMLESQRGELSQAMAFLQAHYTRHLNKENGWDGPIFRSRFKNRLVEDDTWWAHLAAYLHLNPVRGRLVNKPDDGRWTSHAAYMGDEKVPEWLTTAELLELHGGPDGLRQYTHEVQIGRETGPLDFDPDKLWAVAKHQPARPRPVPQVDPYLTAEDALNLVVMATGTKLEQLRTHRRGNPPNKAAWVAAWWLNRRTRLTHAQIGKALGFGQTGVAQRLTRLGKDDDPITRSWMRRLDELDLLLREPLR